MAIKTNNSSVKVAIEKIKGLMLQEKWNDAHRACLELLRFDPDNIKIIRLKNKVEKKVTQMNRRAIKDDLNNLKVLLREKKFDKLMPHIKALQPYAKQYPPLEKFIYKAQKSLRKELIVKHRKDFDDGIAEMKKLIDKNEFARAVLLSQKLRKMEMQNNKIDTLTKSLGTKWIDHELEANKGLLQTKKYEDIILFYEKLLHFDNKSYKVKKMLKKVKKEYDLYKIDQKRDFIYKQIELLTTQYQLGKYDIALEIAHGILEIDPHNRKVRSIFRRANRRAKNKLDKQVIKQIKKSHKALKEDYKEHKKDYIKL